MITSTATDIRSRVSTALAASATPRLRNVQVELNNGEVCLSGHVDSFYQKQMAQEVVRSIDAEVQVRNELHVQAS